MSSAESPPPNVPLVPAEDGLDFVVGQDKAGRWLALEIHGRAGGIFASRDAALHYALMETGHRPEAVRLATDPVELQI